jgi:hypothetical protein
MIYSNLSIQSELKVDINSSILYALQSFEEHFKASEENNSLQNVLLVKSYHSALKNLFETSLNSKNTICISQKIDEHLQKLMPSTSFLGFQRHLVSQQALDKLNYDSPNSKSLGLLSADLESIEPIIRASSRAIIDLNVLKNSDFSGEVNKSTGLTLESLCQIMNYLGRSQELREVIFILEDELVSLKNVESIATLLWYLNEGAFLSKSTANDFNYELFYVQHKDFEDNLVFYLDLDSSQWWVMIENSKGEKTPCLKSDYDNALKGIIDDSLLNRILFLTS